MKIESYRNLMGEATFYTYVVEPIFLMGERRILIMFIYLFSIIQKKKYTI